MFCWYFSNTLFTTNYNWIVFQDFSHKTFVFLICIEFQGCQYKISICKHQVKKLLKDIYILGTLSIEIKKGFYWENIIVETFCQCATTQAPIQFQFKGKSLNAYFTDILKHKNWNRYLYCLIQPDLTRRTITVSESQFRTHCSKATPLFYRIKFRSSEVNWYTKTCIIS